MLRLVACVLLIFGVAALAVVFSRVKRVGECAPPVVQHRYGVSKCEEAWDQVQVRAGRWAPEREGACGALHHGQGSAYPEPPVRFATAAEALRDFSPPSYGDPFATGATRVSSSPARLLPRQLLSPRTADRNYIAVPLYVQGSRSLIQTALPDGSGDTRLLVFDTGSSEAVVTGWTPAPGVPALGAQTVRYGAGTLQGTRFLTTMILDLVTGQVVAGIPVVRVSAEEPSLRATLGAANGILGASRQSVPMRRVLARPDLCDAFMVDRTLATRAVGGTGGGTPAENNALASRGVLVLGCLDVYTSLQGAMVVPCVPSPQPQWWTLAVPYVEARQPDGTLVGRYALTQSVVLCDSGTEHLTLPPKLLAPLQESVGTALSPTAYRAVADGLPTFHFYLGPQQVLTVQPRHYVEWVAGGGANAGASPASSHYRIRLQAATTLGGAGTMSSDPGAGPFLIVLGTPVFNAYKVGFDYNAKGMVFVP